MWMMTTRRPADGFVPANGRLNRLMDSMLSDWPFQGGAGTITSGWVPAVDAFENQTEIKLVAELPGLKPEDVKISLEHNVLTLRGEKKQTAETSTERVHHYERSYGAFERVFTLPTTVDAEQIQATYEHGLLTITLPKVERARPREIPVKTA